MKPVRALIVDDSPSMRAALTRILSGDPEIEVVGAAPEPHTARDMIKELNPDVLTLDVEMPGMDGLSFLERIMRLRPMPVVMCSSLTAAGAEVTIEALRLGVRYCGLTLSCTTQRRPRCASRLDSTPRDRSLSASALLAMVTHSRKGSCTVVSVRAESTAAGGWPSGCNAPGGLTLPDSAWISTVTGASPPGQRGSTAKPRAASAHAVWPTSCGPRGVTTSHHCSGMACASLTPARPPFNTRTCCVEPDAPSRLRDSTCTPARPDT